MEDKPISQQESLLIIQQMIDHSKEQLQDRSKYFLMWGIGVLACSLTQYFLLKALKPNTQVVWMLMPLLAIVHIYIARKEIRKERVLTYNNKAIRALWMALAISFIILSIMSAKISFSMFPFLILLYGIGTFTTGSILQFRPLVIGGSLCFILCILINYIDGPEKLLILALSVVVSYILPAILLKREYQRTHA